MLHRMLNRKLRRMLHRMLHRKLRRMLHRMLHRKFRRMRRRCSIGFNALHYWARISFARISPRHIPSKTLVHLSVRTLQESSINTRLQILSKSHPSHMLHAVSGDLGSGQLAWRPSVPFKATSFRLHLQTRSSTSSTSTGLCATGWRRAVACAV